MLDRTLKYLNVETGTHSSTFSDSDKVSTEAQSAVGTMQALNIFTGKADNKFDPYAKLTCAQMAKVLMNTLEIADVFKNSCVHIAHFYSK